MTATEKSPRRRLFLFGALAALAGALFIGSAVASDGWGPGFCDGSEMTVDTARERAGAIADRALSRVDATDAQRSEVSTILDEAVPKLFDARAEHRANHDAWKDALGAETIDRDALEALRADAIESADEVSTLGLDVVADLAEVLDADQRAELIELAESFKGRRHR